MSDNQHPFSKNPPDTMSLNGGGGDPPSKENLAQTHNGPMNNAASMDMGASNTSFSRFLFHNGISSFSMRLIFLCALPLFAISQLLISVFEQPDLTFQGVPVAPTFRTAAIFLLHFVLTLVILHILLRLSHDSRLLSRWSFLHYASELEYYLALVITIITWLVLLAFPVISTFAIERVFLRHDFLQQINNLGLVAVITSAILAWKQHQITSLAMSFNYTNYCDRVQECLFGDRIITLLLRARHTYKFRQKWRHAVGSGSNQRTVDNASDHSGVNYRQQNAHTISLTTSSNQQHGIGEHGNSGTSAAQRILKSATVRSVVELFGGHGNGSSSSSNTNHPSSNNDSSNSLTIPTDDLPPISTSTSGRRYSAPDVTDGSRIAVQDNWVNVDPNPPSSPTNGNDVSRRPDESSTATSPTSMYSLDSANEQSQLASPNSSNTSTNVTATGSRSMSPNNNASGANAANAATNTTQHHRSHTTLNTTMMAATSPSGVLTDSEKKRQFSDFFRLANRMATRLNDVSDYRNAINQEAERLAEKLYKYLLAPVGYSINPNGTVDTNTATGSFANMRTALMGQDLLAYIEDEDEFCRAITLLKRHIDGVGNFNSLSFNSASALSSASQPAASSSSGASNRDVHVHYATGAQSPMLPSPRISAANTSTGTRNNHSNSAASFSGRQRHTASPSREHQQYVSSSTGNMMMDMREACSFSMTRDDLKRALAGHLTEVWVTSKSLQTIETALGKVNSFLTVLVGIVVIIVLSLVMGGKDASDLMVATSTVLSAAAFAFGTSARNMFESMMFILFLHPFDVGDRVFIPLGTTVTPLASTVATMAGVDALDNLIVEEMHLLSTVFERWDGVKLYVPNYLLANKPIYNIRRSGPLLEMIPLHIDFGTPREKIDLLLRRVEDFVRQESTDFRNLARVMVESIENCNKLIISVIFQHVSNWQDMDIHIARHSKMIAFLKDTIDDLRITYLPPIQRVAIVNPMDPSVLFSGHNSVRPGGEFGNVSVTNSRISSSAAVATGTMDSFNAALDGGNRSGAAVVAPSPLAASSSLMAHGEVVVKSNPPSLMTEGERLRVNELSEQRRNLS